MVDWGQLNMVADAYAKVALWRQIESDGRHFNVKPISYSLPSLTTAYSGTEVTIASNLKKRLKNHIAQTRLMKYWGEQGRPVLTEDFDQEVFTHAVSNAPYHQQIWLP